MTRQSTTALTHAAVTSACQLLDSAWSRWPRCPSPRPTTNWPCNYATCKFHWRTARPRSVRDRPRSCPCPTYGPPPDGCGSHHDDDIEDCENPLYNVTIRPLHAIGECAALLRLRQHLHDATGLRPAGQRTPGRERPTPQKRAASHSSARPDRVNAARAGCPDKGRSVTSCSRWPWPHRTLALHQPRPRRRGLATP